MIYVHQIESRVICCCRAWTWAFVIGWLEIISGAIGTILFGILLILTTANAVDYDDTSYENKFGIAVLATGAIALLCQFVAGIILIVGVKQPSGRKLMLWCVTQILFLIMPVLGLAVSLLGPDILLMILMLVLFAIKVQFIWVVNIHRQEIKKCDL